MTPEIRIPSNANDVEAAAIAAAVDAHLASLPAESPDETDGKEPTWEGRRWRFQGRMEHLQARNSRVPIDAPTDAWRASNRTELY